MRAFYWDILESK